MDNEKAIKEKMTRIGISAADMESFFAGVERVNKEINDTGLIARSTDSTDTSDTSGEESDETSTDETVIDSVENIVLDDSVINAVAEVVLERLDAKLNERFATKEQEATDTQTELKTLIARFNELVSTVEDEEDDVPAVTKQRLAYRPSQAKSDNTEDTKSLSIAERAKMMIGNKEGGN